MYNLIFPLQETSENVTLSMSILALHETPRGCGQAFLLTSNRIVEDLL